MKLQCFCARRANGIFIFVRTEPVIARVRGTKDDEDVYERYGEPMPPVEYCARETIRALQFSMEPLDCYEVEVEVTVLRKVELERVA